ncbi:hypothetical protein BOO91_15495 [Vibrio navarrensis]|uniref:diguanylate cyclase n=1 Tax=Vibrio navarrensis TaxID=29495 RepID=A0AAJ4IFB7_9VIBR|nr:diguanylate cyclase [Vibrio navarrensis]MBE3652392.1 hypothetical protein [Vibrio navarrensis]MBE3658757.1 hypothetical protein [Vibrio navarrensis]MBE3662339.1 hypothetical protein [Vibrio navarrensis]QPL55661.1 diguanylate cyclase [Vibrio navarrensis]
MIRLVDRSFVSTRSVLSVISWLFFMLAVAIIGSLYYLLISLDDMSASEFKQRVSLALDVEKKHHQDILSEYTYWDEAYFKIFHENDEEWVRINTGSFLINSYNLSFSLAFEKRLNKSLLVNNENSQALTVDEIMNDDFHQLSDTHYQNEEEKKLSSGYITINNNLYLIVVGPFIDESTYQPRENGFLVIGIKMDSDYILYLAKKYNLGHLSVASSTHVASKDEESMILLSPTGTPAAKIIWMPNLPSTAVLPNITLIIILFSLVAIVVTRYILLAEQKNRTAYENKIYLEATRDSLTNISNRRHFMEQANKEFTSARKNNERFFVLVLDLDHFKAINDTYGHRSGDKALIHFVRLCEQHLSERDIFGRIGGEEFALVLSRYNRSHAMYKAYAIRKAVMENPLQEKRQTISMTVSIGVAECTNQATLDELLEEADKAMYQAKHAGRNQVIQL